MTLLWFFIWLVCNLVGDKEVLTFDPVNWWAGTLLFAIAVDLSAGTCSRPAAAADAQVTTRSASGTPASSSIASLTW